MDLFAFIEMSERIYNAIFYFSLRILTKEHLNIYTCASNTVSNKYKYISTISDVGKCNISLATDDAIISWERPDEFWNLETSDTGVESVQDDRKHLRPMLPKNWKYIASTKRRNFENALKTCRALGGRLPLPNE